MMDDGMLREAAAGAIGYAVIALSALWGWACHRRRARKEPGWEAKA